MKSSHRKLIVCHLLSVVAWADHEQRQENGHGRMSRPPYLSCFKIAGCSGTQITVIVEIQWEINFNCGNRGDRFDCKRDQHS